MILISNFLFSISLTFVLQLVSLNNFLTLGILFLAAVRVLVVTKLVILGISPLISFILVSRVVLIDKLVITRILSSIFFILELYTSFLTTSFFTTSLINRNRY